MTTFLRVKNLEKHQHYKDRRPPWIKLHAEVLDDYAFACLQDASKVHLMLLWVLASRMDNRIPNDPTWIARKINATESVDVASLVSAGFLEVCDREGNAVQPASVALASRKQSAMPETETETETETDEKPKGARRSGAARGSTADANSGQRGRREKGEPAPWMGVVAPVWRGAYGGAPPAMMVKVLRPVVREHGEAVVAERLAVYCANTPARFADLHKFVATFGTWTAERRGAAADDEEEDRGARLLEEQQRREREDAAFIAERLRRMQMAGAA